jgi:hypothetical protein
MSVSHDRVKRGLLSGFLHTDERPGQRNKGRTPIFVIDLTEGSIGRGLHGRTVFSTGNGSLDFFDGRKFIPVFLTYQHHRSVTY